MNVVCASVVTIINIRYGKSSPRANKARLKNRKNWLLKLITKGIKAKKTGPAQGRAIIE